VALPATTTALRAWLVDVPLAAVAGEVGWTASSAPIVNAVDMVALLLGHAVETEGATAKLLALAEWQGWEHARAALVTRVDTKAGAVDLKLSQALADARLAASAYPEGVGALGSATAAVTTLGAAGPYAPATSEEWA
jgi:hypothetical protein